MKKAAVFKAGGVRVPHEDYLKAHADLLKRDRWIIDGFGKLIVRFPNRPATQCGMRSTRAWPSMSPAGDS
jgi:hypothetical protein